MIYHLVVSMANYVLTKSDAGQKQDQNAPLSMNELGINMAASGSALSRANSLSMGSTTLSFGRQMNSTIGPGTP